MAEEETNVHARYNSMGVLGALAISIGSIVYSAGYLGATIDDQDRRIEKIEDVEMVDVRRVEKLEERPVTDTTEIEKSLGVLIAKVERYADDADQVKSINDDVIKLKADLDNLTKSINGIPAEFPTVLAKVKQLEQAFDKLDQKKGGE